jgi:deoxyribose-phosphate aldolase
VTAQEAARLIDISAVRTHHGYSDIAEAVNIARVYRFINVHSLPCWTKTVRDLLKDEPDIFTGAPVGFPSGAHTTVVKLLEAEQLIRDGVQEMDIVMNVGRFKSNEDDLVLEELKKIIAIVPSGIRTKVIIEMNVLNDGELDRACVLVSQTGAEFLKTGTGWIPGPVDIKRIGRIKELTGGKIKVKAAGGIRTKEEFETLVNMGVERFGINLESARAIVSSYPQGRT